VRGCVTSRSRSSEPFCRRCCHSQPKEQTIRPAAPRCSGGRINTNITDDMRSGPDQRPRGRFNANRPFKQQQPRMPQTGQTFDSTGPNIKIHGSAHQISSATSPWHAKRRRTVIQLPPRISTSTRSTISASITRAARAISRGRRRGRPHRPTSR
jgi:hypothetical protein